jgi:hypothetical protein
MAIVVGLPDKAVSEARERVRSALIAIQHPHLGTNLGASRDAETIILYISIYCLIFVADSRRLQLFAVLRALSRL